MGIVGELDESIVAIGNEPLMEKYGVDLAPRLEDIQRAAAKGVTISFVSKGKELLGWIEVSDALRPSTKSALKHAKRNNLEVIMLTGDRVEAAEQIAKECGIEQVVANVRPDEKADFITSLKEQGKHVAMIGDGINDATDNCQFVANPDQVDTDGNGIGTACDVDEILSSEDTGALPSIGMLATSLCLLGAAVLVRRD